MASEESIQKIQVAEAILKVASEIESEAARNLRETVLDSDLAPKEKAKYLGVSVQRIYQMRPKNWKVPE